MTRALVLSPDYPPAMGGIQQLVHRIVSNAERLEAMVITLDHPQAPAFDAEQDHRVVRIRPGPDRRLGIVGLNVRALQEARRFKPDVVLAAHIVTAPAAAAIRRLLGVPVCLYLYAKEIGASRTLSAWAVKRADAVIAISEYTRGLAIEVGTDPGRIHLIPPGVDPARLTDEVRRTTPTLLTVARLEDRYKGHDVLTRALPLIRARVPGTEWVVIGSGSLQRDIERLASVLGVQHAIRLCGSLPDLERDRWLDRAHVLSMPSRLPAGTAAGEGFGIVFLEAGMHGIPAVAGDVGGAVDAIVDGETGLLVDPTDHVAVANAIADLLEDPQRAQRMGEAGARHAERFAWPLIARRVEDLLLGLADAPR
jgi:phosphatidylinositol alpha-1,6-mannosyltransferase